MNLITLDTERLRLRPFVPQDGAALATMMGDPEVMQFYGGGLPLSAEAAQSALEYHLQCRDHDYWAWAITHREDGRFVGSVTAGFTEYQGTRWFEPAWILCHREWGHGFATEAARTVVKYAITELHEKRLLATTHHGNHASARVIEKAGFSFIGEAEVRKGRPARVFAIEMK